jgi:choline dehydrogenase-like flavoprotein
LTRDDWQASPRPRELVCDVLVVGSGAGGGVIAAELAAAGLDVIVLEEGGYHATEEFVPEPSAMVRKLYRDGGASVALGTPPIMFSEGRCVGGSTVINGGMTWRTPERVLERWGLSPAEMEPHFERVEGVISAREQPEETFGHDAHIIQRGADRMGWKWIPNVRNQLHCAGSNNCAFGCPTGAKRSVLVSYVPRALQAGARLYADCKVDRLRRKGKRVTGVDAHVTRADGRRLVDVVVHARQTFVCCGAVHTPALLLRSGIKPPSGRLGHNLSLHPNTKVVAIFDEKVEGWKGVHQGLQVRQFVEEGIGNLTAVNVPPSIVAMSLPHRGAELGRIMAEYPNMVIAGILVEDTTLGRVRALPGGAPLATYQMNDADAHNLVRGTRLLCDLLFAAGARRILLPFEGCPDLLSADDTRKVFSRAIPKRSMEVVTMHIMGTAGMGDDPMRHVCDPWGKVYDTEGLRIADASLFPTPVGTNPMETVMALATRIAGHVVENRA